jgi:hypothetical protein
LSVAVTSSCAPRRPAPANPEGLAVGVTAAACARTETDADRDALDDGCELALARAFAPLLRADRRDCLWSDSTGRLGGGYLFAAQPVAGSPAGGVRLAYLPAYFRDCGWTGAVCLLKGRGCGAHDGDSELVLVDVAPAADGRWAATAVFLSAHCFGRSAGRCRWFRGEALGDFAWADGVARGAPVVWVARGKHAHYPTHRACDRGHWGYDSCDDNDVAYRFPVLGAAQNVGSRAAPLPTPDGCVGGSALPLGAAGAAPGARECVWDRARPFRGWQGAAAGAAPSAYARYLLDVAGF